jgi:hypothetical protein
MPIRLMTLWKGKAPRKPENWDDDRPSADSSDTEEKEEDKKTDDDSSVGGPLGEH